MSTTVLQMIQRENQEKVTMYKETLIKLIREAIENRQKQVEIIVQEDYKFTTQVDDSFNRELKKVSIVENFYKLVAHQLKFNIVRDGAMNKFIVKWDLSRFSEDEIKNYCNNAVDEPFTAFHTYVLEVERSKKFVEHYIKVNYAICMENMQVALNNKNLNMTYCIDYKSISALDRKELIFIYDGIVDLLERDHYKITNKNRGSGKFDIIFIPEITLLDGTSTESKRKYKESPRDFEEHKQYLEDFINLIAKRTHLTITSKLQSVKNDHLLKESDKLLMAGLNEDIDDLTNYFGNKW